MKNRLILISTLVVISIFAAGAVFANQGVCTTDANGREGHYKEKAAAMAAELKLTPEQEKQLNETKAAHRSEMMTLSQQLKAKQKELKDTLANPSATKQGVEPIANQIKALQSQMVDRRIDGILKVKEVLTPEQYQKLQTMKEEHNDKPHRKHGEKGWKK